MSAGEKTPEDELRRVNPELALLFDSLRSEFEAKLTGLKLWGALVMLMGGTIGGVVSQYLAPEQTHAAIRSLLSFV